MQYIHIKGRDEPVYDTIDEFKEYYPFEEVVPWRKCSQEGIWVETDEGTICEAFKFGFFNDSATGKKTKYVQTPYGTYLVTQRMEGEPKKNKSSLFESSSKPKKSEVLFAGLLLKGFSFNEACLIAFGKKRSKEYLFKKESVLKELQKQGEDKLADAGFDDDYILNKIRGLIDDEKNPASVRADLLKALAKARSLFGNENDIKSVIAFGGFSRDELDRYRNPDDEIRPEVSTLPEDFDKA